MANGNCDVIVIVIYHEPSGSTSRCPAVAPAMARSSASSHAALPVASQGAKQSDEPCYRNFKLATYNIGAKNNESFQGPLRDQFMEKLTEDIRCLINDGVHVLCLQEVSWKWEYEMVDKILPSGWKSSCASNCMIAYHGASWKTCMNQSNELLFPEDSKNVYRNWRTLLRVTLEAKDETKFIIGNLHVVSGSAVTKSREGIVTQNHTIPGKTREKREEFKQKCVQNALEHMLKIGLEGENGPDSGKVLAAPQGPVDDKTVLVLAGDFNLLPPSFKQAIEEATSDEIKAMSAVGLSSNKGQGKRDWIICNKPIAAPDVATFVSAWDNAHAAIIGEWSAMSEHAAMAAEAEAAMAAKAATATRFSTEDVAARAIQRMVTLRRRLSLRKAERLFRNAEAQRAEEEEMQAAVKQQGGKRQREEEEIELEEEKARCCGRCRCRRRC